MKVIYKRIKNKTNDYEFIILRYGDRFSVSVYFLKKDKRIICKDVNLIELKKISDEFNFDFDKILELLYGGDV
jgi:hypothetical protein